ncbi:phosducin-like protein [Oscarella lobularis]|uniref:phosducin-like protein n=1 Tax=Oscarella lobularis TaxID=121494 RepID=UPI00331365D9
MDRSSDEEESADESRAPADPPLFQYGPPTGPGPKTGPKGVIRDHAHYLALKAEEEAQKQAKSEKASRNADADLESDPFVEQYKAKRLKQLQERAAAAAASASGGNLVHLTPATFESSIDDNSYVVVHLYDDSIEACRTMNKCLTRLAAGAGYAREAETTVRFCRMRADDAPVSARFRADALPALLVYRDGKLAGNFIRVSDELGDEFYADEVAAFLRERNCLPPEQADHKSTVDDLD